jgi:hypothetical protein
MVVWKNAKVVGNSRGMLFAQVAENGEYRCWAIDSGDVSRFRLREHDEVVIDCAPGDQFCKVVQVGFPED